MVMTPTKIIIMETMTAAMEMWIQSAVAKARATSKTPMAKGALYPLQRPADLSNVVGVVRNGRFYSAIGLIEKAQPAARVE
jgi:hypothetical protein